MLYIVLPIYNEASRLEGLIVKISKVLSTSGISYRIIAVNDGSSDSSADVLSKVSADLPVTVITHKMNRGLGETIRDGFEAAAEGSADGDVIVRLDADDTQDPSLIPQMYKKIQEGYDVVVASRYASGGEEVGLTFKRKFFSRAANLLMKVSFPVKGLWDYSCGYRAYRASIVKRAITVFGNGFIELKGLGFTVTPEKLVKLIRLGARVAEVPLVLRYDLKESQSKMESYATIMGYVILISKNIGQKKIKGEGGS
ncbi:MAG: glycosyltransferase family 2 protein [Nitrospirae bacterium]|nr:glycosyltransferase family 2 protein [Nitrospirota bacterium]MBI5694221.1 glycosyltransferase family 2 protein [Nitrospirota bacterium]